MSWHEEMVEALKNAKNGEKNLIMKGYSQMTGKSTKRLYEIAKKYGYNTGRKTRSDKGECRVTEMQIKYVAGLIITSAREKKGTIMPVKEALDKAEQNNIIDPGCVSVSRMHELLRQRGLNKAALNAATPHTNMRSRHPNHVHFVDVSVCIQYYLKKNELRIMREDLFYKNKFENFAKIKQKIFRYVLTDHFSHTMYVKYYIARGETQNQLFDFLVSAWGVKDIKNFPFRGVPYLIMMDRGGANISKAIIKFIERLNVKFPEPGKHNPRRQGSVEQAQNFVESYFESKLRFQPADSIEKLNVWALDWCTYMNASPNHIHSRLGTPRIHCWLRIQQDQLRERPDLEILQDLYRNPAKECKVYGDYSIRFRGERFRINHVEGVIPNVSKVLAHLKPYTWPEILVEFDEKTYVATPIQKADGGFDADAAVIGENYKAMPMSPTERRIQEIKNLAYGEDRKKDDLPFPGVHMFGGQADRIETEFMPRQSTPMEVGRTAKEDIAHHRISMFDLLKDLAGAGTLTPALNKAVRAKYGDSITLADRDTVVDAMAAGLLCVNHAGELKIERRDDDRFTAAAN